MNRTLIIIFAIALLLGLLMLAKKGLNSNDDKRYTVELKVTGTAQNVMVTYMTPTNGVEQVADANVPWSKLFECNGENRFSISAQNHTDNGSVVVSIYMNGMLANSAQSTGAYVVAQTQISLRP